MRAGDDGGAVDDGAEEAIVSSSGNRMRHSWQCRCDCRVWCLGFVLLRCCEEVR